MSKTVTSLSYMLWCFLLLSTCLMGHFDGQWVLKRGVRVCVRAPSGTHNPETPRFQRRVWVISWASGQTLAVGWKEGVVGAGRKERGGGLLYQLPDITERRLFARQKSTTTVLGRQTHLLAATCHIRLTEHIGLYLVWNSLWLPVD